MARFRSFLAILLALALAVSPTTAVYADGGDDYNAGGGDTNDGHPWDDDAVEDDPGSGNDPNTPGLTPSTGDLPTMIPPSAATSGSAAQMIASAITSVMNSWFKVRELKVQKSTSGTRRTR